MNSRFLTWALSQSDLQQQPDWVKAEVVLLARQTDNKSLIDLNNFSFSDEKYRLMSKVFIDKTSLTEAEAVYLSTLSDDIEAMYTLRVTEQEPHTCTADVLEDNPLLILHKIFFCSDFARYPLNKPELVQYISDRVNTNPFSSIPTEYQVLDWTAECLLANLCLGQEDNIESHPELLLLDTYDINWGNYHSFLVLDLIRATEDGV